MRSIYTILLLFALYGTSLVAQCPFDISLTINDAPCYNAVAGPLAIELNGAELPADYLLSGPVFKSGTTNDSVFSLGGLLAGVYYLSVTDAASCEAGRGFEIKEPDRLKGHIGAGFEGCAGDSCSLLLNASASGGTPPYAFLWNTGDTSAQLHGACALYPVTVTDANGCVTEAVEYTITEPTWLSFASIDVGDVLCKGGSDGYISIYVSGGSAPYSYQWSNGATSPNLSNLLAGDYSVTVTDDDGCIEMALITVSEPEVISIMTELIVADCNVDCAYDLDVRIEGGTPPYGVLWNNGATTEVLEKLCRAELETLSVQITDANGCYYTFDESVKVPDSLSADVVVQNTSCHGCADGSIRVEMLSGNPPYNYWWNFGPGTNYETGLAAGEYQVVIEDSLSCTIELTIEVLQPPLNIPDPGPSHIWWNIQPNPVADEALLSFDLQQKEQIRLQLLDVQGKLVRQLSGWRKWTAGQHGLLIERGSLAAGVYLMVLETNSGVVLVKILVLN